jgi:hypothetical protein
MPLTSRYRNLFPNNSYIITFPNPRSFRYCVLKIVTYKNSVYIYCYPVLPSRCVGYIYTFRISLLYQEYINDVLLGLDAV